MKVIQETRLVD